MHSSSIMGISGAMKIHACAVASASASHACSPPTSIYLPTTCHWMPIPNSAHLDEKNGPLDAHPELGNNAQLGQKLGLLQTGRTGENDLIAIGQWDAQSAEASVGTLGELARQVELALGRTPLLLGDPARPVRHVAWCSGGAQSYFEEAIASGVDVFITGEVSEPNYHLAIESGVGFIAAGHHATERFGVQALGAHLALHFGVEHQYIDIANPI